MVKKFLQACYLFYSFTGPSQNLVENGDLLWKYTILFWVYIRDSHVRCHFMHFGYHVRCWLFNIYILPSPFLSICRHSWETKKKKRKQRTEIEREKEKKNQSCNCKKIHSFKFGFDSLQTSSWCLIYLQFDLCRMHIHIRLC
jgi:hypothetical protein